MDKQKLSIAIEGGFYQLFEHEIDNYQPISFAHALEHLTSECKGGAAPALIKSWLEYETLNGEAFQHFYRDGELMIVASRDYWEAE